MAPMFVSQNTRAHNSDVHYSTSDHTSPNDLQHAHANEFHEPTGDLLLEKPEGTTRFYFQNVNGIKIDKDKVQFRSLLRHMQLADCDCFGFSETKIENKHHALCQQLQHGMESCFQNYRHKCASSPTKFNTYHKPGGVASFAAGDLTTRVVKQIPDSLGRWTQTRFVGRDNKILNVINVCQCVHHQLSPCKTQTACAQQHAALRALDRDIDPRKAFILDLKTLVQQLRQQDEDIILAGDFNEILGERDDGLLSVVRAGDLLDVIATRHSPSANKPTYKRGSRVIDYVFATRSVYDCISSCGAEPFDARIASDHRGFFLDLDARRCFGREIPTIAARNARGIVSAKPEDVSKHMKHLCKHFDKHNANSLLDDLEAAPQLRPMQANKLDKIITDGMLHAEKKVKRKRRSPWSPTLLEAVHRVELWKKIVSSKANNFDNAAEIRKSEKRLSSSVEIPESVDECRAEYHKALRQLRIESRKAYQARQQHLENLVEQCTLADDTADKKKILKRIKKAEEIKALFKKLRFLHKPSQRSGISRVLLPDDGNSPSEARRWKACTVPTEIESHLLDRNQTHFGQAQGAPFTVPPLSHAVDWNASSIESNLILNGEHEKGTLNDLAQLVIDELKTDIPPLPTSVSLDDFKKKHKLWKESTSTSPSGRHLGHCKCLVIKNPHKKGSDESPNPDHDRFQRNQTRILSIHHRMTNYALKHGFSHDRWQCVINAMLEKDPGSPKTHRLRVIHLHESDYNLILAVKWRHLVHHNEDEKNFNEGQCGGRPGRTAHDPVHIEQVQNEISRLSRRPFVKFSNDAKACCDRIIPSLANLASRKHGMSGKVCEVHGNALKRARCKLKTGLRVSDRSYTHTQRLPIYGTGQGSGCSPICWLVISCALFDAFETKAHGAVYASPDRRLSITTCMISFADDSCCQVMAPVDSACDEASLIEMIQHDAQLWSDLLEVSGGKLELSKCSYHFSWHDFKASGEAFLRPGPFGPPISVRSSQGGLQTIEQKCAFESCKTLGTKQNPGNDPTAMIQFLKARSDGHGIITATSPVARAEAWTFHTTIHNPSVHYPSPVAVLERSEWNKIQDGAMKRIVQKLGLPGNLSPKILHGSPELNGLSMRHGHVEQGLGQLKLLLRSWRSRNQQGIMMRTCMSWAQAVAGVGFSLLRYPNATVPQMKESVLIKAIVAFLRHVRGHIEMDETHATPIQRTNDSHIMDNVRESRSFKHHEIVKINHCRQCLQAHAVSDVTDASGFRLKKGAVEGEEFRCSKTRYVPTIQAKPDRPSWRLWRRAMSSFANEDGSLARPLGDWLVQADQQRFQWKHCVVGEFLCVSNGSETGYAVHEVRQRTRLHCEFWEASVDNAAQIPLQALPTDAVKTNLGFKIRWNAGVAPCLPTATNQMFPLTWEDCVDDLPEWDRSLLLNVSLIVTIQRLRELFESGELLGVSDGSAKPGLGAFGWVLATKDDERLATCSGRVCGSDPGSFRAEGTGLLSMLRYLLHFRRYYGSRLIAKLVLCTDNEGLVKSVPQMQRPFQSTLATFRSEWDILQQIAATIKELENDDLEVKHVKGHQDRQTAYRNLPLPARLNVDADKLAGAQIAEYEDPAPATPFDSTSGAMLVVEGASVTKRISAVVRRAANNPSLKQLIQTRHKWSDATMHDWDADVSRIIASHFCKQRITMVKLVHECLPVGNLLHHRSSAIYERKCYRCDAQREDALHLIRCSSSDVATWRLRLISSLRELHNKVHPNELVDLLMLGLNSLFYDRPLNIQEVQESVRHAAHAQSRIGWHQVFKGRWSRSWNKHWSDHDGHTESKDTDWTGRFGKLSMKFWLDNWKERCKQRQSCADPGFVAARVETARNKVRHLHTKRNQMRPLDRRCFYDNVEDHLSDDDNNSVAQLEEWITINEGMIAHSVERAEKCDGTRQSLMTEYMLVAPGGV